MSQKTPRRNTGRLHEDPLIAEIIEWIELRGSDAEAIAEIAYTLDVEISVLEQVILDLIREGTMVLVGAGVLDYYEGA
jgi:hypothetical protein